MTYTSSSWTADNRDNALDLGWEIAAGEDGQRIKRYGNRFDCDDAAFAYVAHRAMLGDRLARLAIAEVAWQQGVSDAG